MTANFERNLVDIERFLVENAAERAYDELLASLAESVIPNLARYPRIGRTFLERGAYSAQAEQRMRALAARVGPDGLREYVSGDYLILYYLGGATLHLLSIKHQRQLSFDLEARWLAPLTARRAQQPAAVWRYALS
ncbi:MAG: type II toxin-antitoxin system RelE/ParE family toxin [Betaproteobacteria bacterium]